MKKTFKLLRIVLFAIVVLVVAAVVLVNLFANRAVKIGIETAATKALNVGVSLDSVNLSILGGKLTLNNLVINNPPGYKHEKLLELKNATIEIEIKSLLSDVVKIKSIKLDGATVVLEQRGISGNNLRDVAKAIPSEPKAEEKAPGKKLHIDLLEMTNITAKVKLLPVPGKADTLTLQLAPITMKNLGSDNKLDTAALTGKIFAAIFKGIANKGGGVLPDGMVDAMKTTWSTSLDVGKKVIKESADIGKKVLEEGADIGKKALEEGADIGKKIGEGIKGLFGPKKQEE